ncbi:MAG: DNA-processing protein DprA [Dehalococcoidales bacterium]
MSTSLTEKKYWLGFCRIPGIGRVKLGHMERYFGSMENAWKASSFQLNQSGLDSNTADAIINCRRAVNPDAEAYKLEKNGIQALIYHDEDYPARLREIPDYPPVLFLKGALLASDGMGFAVVGSRVPTTYGKQVTRELAGGIAQTGLTVISGLARGVDTIAHQAALEAGGRTIAVCATGLDIIYPASNHVLAEKISRQGAIVSEYPPGTRPRPEYFPRRNRIMSGLSLGVVVTEARHESGALITARLALDYNRDVFAVPGSIYSPNSLGTNALIGEGAKLVGSVNDILEEINLFPAIPLKKAVSIKPESRTEKLLVDALATEPLHIDEIVRNTGLPASEVSSTLAMMELKGWVKQVGVMCYALSRQENLNKKVK